jgi:hypothetical protein
MPYRFSTSALMLAGLATLLPAPASALPVPAVLIDSGLSYARSDKEQDYPSVAFDGTNWLVVWQDKRGDRAAVWGTRVNAAGVPLDSANIRIADDAEERSTPEVAFNGASYLVVWQDGRNHSYDIYGTRVSPAGAVLDPDGIRISRSEETDEYPAVANNGADFLVVWQDSRNSGNDKDIYAARVNGGGQVLDTANIAVAMAAAKQENPAVAGCSGGFLVTWQDWRNEATTISDIYAARVTTAGSVLDPAGIAVSRADSTQEYPALASDGTDCLITWCDYRNSSGDVYGARVSGAGAVLDPSGLPIHASPSFWAGDPCVAYTGTQYLVAWEDDSMTGGNDCDILASRVTTAGQVLDPGGVVVTAAGSNQYWPVIAPGGSDLIVSWQDYRNGDDRDIYSRRVSASGVPLDTVDNMLSMVVNVYEQFNPAAAFDGTNFLTVWHDERAPQTNQKLYGARVTPTGTLLDPGGFCINDYYSSVGAPAVAFGTNSYLVALNIGVSSYAVIAARVTPAGVVLDTSSLYTGITGQGGGPPAVAFDGTNWFVVSAFEDFGGLANVQGVRFATDGTLLDSHAIRLAYLPNGLDAPAVAFGTTSYLAVWQDFRNGSTYDIYGRRVSADGTTLDSAIAISTAATSQHAPSVAFDGTNWLVAWQDNRNGGERECFCTRVSQSGTVLDPAGIRIGSCPDNYDDAVQLAFDGTNYFVVWQWRNYSNGDLWGARVSPAGVVLDTFPVCTAPEYQATPAVAAGTGGQIMVAYSGYVATLHGYPAEKMRIWAGIYPFYSIEEPATPRDPRAIPRATVVRGVLLLPRDMTELPGNSDRVPRPALLDASGRKALDLRPGANDVSALPPGVYFVRTDTGVEEGKVVVTR